jgi:hypothetical protein
VFRSERIRWDDLHDLPADVVGSIHAGNH